MSRSALLVIDVQNGFCHPRGSLARSGIALSGVAAAVARTADAVASARAAAVPVVFTRHVYRPEYADLGRNLRDRSGNVAGHDGLRAGTWDAEVMPELGWSPEDLTVDKPRFDAFLWTSLDPLLAGLGADHLYVAGVVTNICVESTVRAAYMRDFAVTVLGDACAGRTDRLHELSLSIMRECEFAEVIPAAELAGRLSDASRVPA